MDPRLRGSGDTVSVYELHTSVLLEEELAWFFTEAESAAALPSSFDPMCQMSLSGRIGTRANPADDSAEERAEAAHAAGRIERWLRTMPENLAVLLFAAFEPRVWPEELEAEFGRLTGIAVRLSLPPLPTGIVRHGHEREERAAACLTRALLQGGPPVVALLKSRAQVAFVGAIRAYARARGVGPSAIPEER